MAMLTSPMKAVSMNSSWIFSFSDIAINGIFSRRCLDVVPTFKSQRLKNTLRPSIKVNGAPTHIKALVISIRSFWVFESTQLPSTVPGVISTSKALCIPLMWSCCNFNADFTGSRFFAAYHCDKYFMGTHHGKESCNVQLYVQTCHLSWHLRETWSVSAFIFGFLLLPQQYRCPSLIRTPHSANVLPFLQMCPALLWRFSWHPTTSSKISQ